MKKDARFYFANLGADVARCVSAAQMNDETRYQDSLARSYRTLSYLRTAQRPEAYEEGMLLLRGLQEAKETNQVLGFATHSSALIAQYSLII